MKSKYFQIFLGATIITYIFYSRLILTRTPRELSLSLDLLKLSLYSIIVSVMIMLVCYNIYKYYNMGSNIKDGQHSKYLSYIKSLYQHPKNPLLFWGASIVLFDIYLKNKTPNYDARKNYAHHIVENLAEFLKSYGFKSLFVLVGSRIILQGFVCLMFFIDVIINQKFYYFYKYSWILIIPMIISYILYSIKLHIDKNLESLNEVLRLRIIYKQDLDDTLPIDDPFNLDKSLIVSVDDWYDITQKCKEIDKEVICFNALSEEMLIKIDSELEQEVILNNCIDSMSMLFTFRTYVKNYEEYKNKIEIPFNILKYLIYAIAWSYVLYLGIAQDFL